MSDGPQAPERRNERPTADRRGTSAFAPKAKWILVATLVALAIVTWRTGPSVYQSVVDWTRIKAAQIITRTRTDPREFLKTVDSSSLEPVEFTIKHRAPITTQLPDARAKEAQRTYTTPQNVPRFERSWTLKMPRAYIRMVGFDEDRLNEVRILARRSDWSPASATMDLNGVEKKTIEGDTAVWVEIGATYTFPARQELLALLYHSSTLDLSTCEVRYLPSLDLTEIAGSPGMECLRSADRVPMVLGSWRAYSAGNDQQKPLFQVLCTSGLAHSDDRRPRQQSPLCKLHAYHGNWGFTVRVTSRMPEQWWADYRNALVLLRSSTIAMDD